MKIEHIIYTLVLTTFFSCSNSTSEDITETLDIKYEWNVPLNDIVGNFSPFPSAENPILSPIDLVEGLNDNSTVAIIAFNGEINIYPLSYIQPYETVNDQIANNSFTVSYCPITESTIAFNRNHTNQLLTFRASGFLYKENLVMYDSATESFWSQILLKNIRGPFESETLTTFTMFETTWKTAKTYFPSAKVFTNKSIVSSKTNKSLEHINNNERVFGLIDNISNKSSKVFIYQYSQFENGIQIYNSGFTSDKIVIGSKELRFITAFKNENKSTFTVVQNEFPVIMIDNLGNKWNIFGIVVSGPNKGDKLQTATSFVAAWWAWEEFYTNFSFLD